MVSITCECIIRAMTDVSLQYISAGPGAVGDCTLSVAHISLSLSDLAELCKAGVYSTWIP